MTKASASCPPACATGSTTCDSVVTSIACGSSTTAAHAAIASERMPPSGKPTNTFARSVPRSFRVHFSSTAPDEKKNTSYGRHRRAEQRDREVPVRERIAGCRVPRLHRLARELPPIGLQQEQGDHEDDEGEPEQARDVLHRAELRAPDHDPDREQRDGDPQPGPDAGGELQGERDAADLGREREQVDEERRAEVREPDARAESLADDLEGRATADRRDPSRHVGIDADAGDADDDDPREPQSEPRADDGVRDEIADVDETADGGQDAEGDREDALHPSSSSSRRSSTDAVSAASPAACIAALRDVDRLERCPDARQRVVAILGVLGIRRLMQLELALGVGQRLGHVAEQRRERAGQDPIVLGRARVRAAPTRPR